MDVVLVTFLTVMGLAAGTIAQVSVRSSVEPLAQVVLVLSFRVTVTVYLPALVAEVVPETV